MKYMCIHEIESTQMNANIKQSSSLALMDIHNSNKKFKAIQLKILDLVQWKSAIWTYFVW